MNLQFEDYENFRINLVFDSEDYRFIEDYSEGLAATKHNNELCGYIDCTGYETLLYDYNFVGNFHNDRAIVQNKSGLYGYIDKTFKEVIPCNYAFATDFEIGYAVVKNNKETIIIDINGNKINTLDKNIEIYNLKKILLKLNLIAKNQYKNLLENSEIQDDVIIKENFYPGVGYKTYSYFDINNNKIIPYPNMEKRKFINNLLIVKLADHDIRIFNKKGKQLKIRTKICFNSYNKDSISTLVKNIKYTSFNIQRLGYISKLRFDDSEYNIIAKDYEDLLQKKIDVLYDIKNNINDYLEQIELEINKLKGLNYE